MNRWRIDGLSAAVAATAAAVLVLALVAGRGEPEPAAAASPAGSSPPSPTASSPASPAAPSPTASPEAPEPEQALPRSATPLPADTLVFSSTSPDGVTLASVAAATGAVPAPLTPAGNLDLRMPALSPDRRTVAYLRGINESDGELRMMAADGSADVGTGTELFLGDRVAWSPDGTQLAYVQRTPDQSEIIVADLDVTESSPKVVGQRSVLPDEGARGDVAWSPDGTRLAYWAVAVPGDGNSFEIFVVDLRDGQVERVTDNNVIEQDPAWSPDSASLVFTREPGGEAGKELHVVDLASRQERLLVGGGEADNQDPAWSPDGAWIAFTRGTEPTSHLWRVRSDGSEEQALTSGDAGEGQASWGISET